MKRWPFSISPHRAVVGGLVCLVFSIGTTIAVAWGLVIAARPPGHLSLPRSYDPAVTRPLTDKYVKNAGVTGGLFDVSASHWTGVGVRRWIVDAMPTPSSPFVGDVGVDLIEWTAGFPANALTGAYIRLNGDRQGRFVHGALIYRQHTAFSATSFLPTKPIWGGLTLNTLFYAVVWFNIWLVWIGVRHFRRTRRGMCPRCQYDLRGNLQSGCPECGWRREPATHKSAEA